MLTMRQGICRGIETFSFLSDRALLTGGVRLILAITIGFSEIAQAQLPNPPAANPPASSPFRQMSAEEFSSRGFQKFGKGDYQGAIADYTQAIKLNPDDDGAFHGRALSRYQLGDKRGAFSDYTQAIKLKKLKLDSTIDFGFAYLYRGRGDIRSELGDKLGAIEDYTQAIKFMPFDSYTYVMRGRTRFEFGDNRGAMSDFDRAIKWSPDYAFAYENRGLFHAKLGDKLGAINDLQKSADLYLQGNHLDSYQKVVNVIKKLVGGKRSTLTLTEKEDLKVKQGDVVVKDQIIADRSRDRAH